METRKEQRDRLSTKFSQLSEESKAKVYRLFPASCNGLSGAAAYFPSVGRNAGALETLMFRLSREEGKT